MNNKRATIGRPLSYMNATVSLYSFFNKRKCDGRTCPSCPFRSVYSVTGRTGKP